MKMFAVLVIAVVVLETVKTLVFGLLILAAIQLAAYVVKRQTDLRLDASRRARYGITD